MKPILTLAGELAARRTTSQALVEDALVRIAVPSGEGARVFLRTHRESALAEAKASDQLRALGLVPSPLASFKSTARRIPKDGTFPLPTILDSVGSIAPSVVCCALVDSILAGDAPQVAPALR